ncbi:MAG: Pycsar system effector family protein [Lysobacterales bacterium]
MNSPDSQSTVPSEPATAFAEVRERGSADYLLRTIQQHHVQLSFMADTKANIIITVTSIVMTLALGRVNDPLLCWSALILIVFSLLALFTAILAILPKFRSAGVSEATEPYEFNLLFFGHFVNLDEPSFQRHLASAMQSDGGIYRVLAHDLYSLGSYLGRHKYPYLRMSYRFFLSGFVIAAVVQMAIFAMRWGQ